MKKVVVYPRGFAAYGVGWPIVRVDNDLSVANAAARYANVNSRERVSMSAGNIENLYKAFMTNQRSPKSLDFVTDLYAVAVNAFGTTSFYDWLHMQTQNPYFTSDHRDFLNETLEFIFGRERLVSMGSWRMIIRYHMNETGPVVNDYRYQQFFLNRGKEEQAVTSVIRRWIARPSGAQDLLATLHILFGEVITNN